LIIFFKKTDRDGNGQRSADAPSTGEQRTSEEAPRQPAPKVQRVNAESQRTII
jgi:hypothetical protein